MTDAVLFALTLVAAVASGVMAGVFFAFSAFVMRALARLPAPQGIAAMQAINVAVINPLFLGTLFGTGALGAALAALALALPPPEARYLLAGGVLYVGGIVVVTMLGNVPLNNALAAVAPDSAEGKAMWERYLVRWVAWNHARTVTGTAASAAFVLALG